MSQMKIKKIIVQEILYQNMKLSTTIVFNVIYIIFFILCEKMMMNQ